MVFAIQLYFGGKNYIGVLCIFITVRRFLFIAQLIVELTCKANVLRTSTRATSIELLLQTFYNLVHL